MSFAGFKKQFNKTSQYLSEKVGGNKGSQLEEEYVELARQLDVVHDAVEGMLTKTKEYLQPNPNARTKLSMQASYQKARGQAHTVKYPQPEFNLAEVLSKAGASLDEYTPSATPYATSLSELGASFNQLSEIKDSMEFNVKQNFLDPLYELQQKDLKEISHHRKKLESRRLDFDYKKGKGDKVPEEEIQAAEEKFIESKQLSYNSMMNFVESDVEHIGQLQAFAEAIRDYHKQCADVMEAVAQGISSKLTEAASRPRAERITIISHRSSHEDNISVNSYDMIPSETISSPAKSAITPPPPAKEQARCRALYDFEPENEGELEFKENDIIELKSRIDENWLEGAVHGNYGYFPENYVEIIVPL